MAADSSPDHGSPFGVLRVRTRLTPTQRVVGLAFLADIALFVIGGLHSSSFLAFSNITTMLLLSSFIGLAAAGQTFVILIGGIDLSIPWVLNAMAVMLTTVSLGQDNRAWWVVPLVLLTGAAVGMVNGLGIVLFEVPPVVMTLGMNGIMEGAVLGLTGGFTCATCKSNAPQSTQAITTEQLLPNVPNILLIWLLVAVVVGLVLSFTVLGRRIYALGNNPMAAYLSGVNTRLVTVAVYAIGGFFAAIAGIALCAYEQQATLAMGDPYLFQSIAAVVIGGASILGGRGVYWGTVAGAVFITVLPAILEQYQISDAGRSIASGVVILVALLLYGREQREV